MSESVSPAEAWQPAATLATAQRRAGMLASAREYFAQQNILEVDSPILSRAAVSDPNIESVSAQLQIDLSRDYFLQTSPEFSMKRLLCAGYPDIYEICKVFRDGESGKRHQPEFTMVEWYRRDFGLQEIIHDTVAFVAALVDPVVLNAPPSVFSYQDAFMHFTGVDPLHDGLQDLMRSTDCDAQLQASLGTHRDGWLDLILTQKVAPGFARDRLTVVSHYPASQAALARLTPDNPVVADRFEVFLGDLELANGYVELTDAREQRARCARDQELRRISGRRLRLLDETFLAALDAGMPACAGVAVGFDRLLMINSGTDDIRNVQSFTF